jgi:Tripartite tricarboxylate transporter family receptor
LLSSSTGTTLLRAAADNRLVGSSSPPFSANSPELAGILARVLSPQSVDWISRALSVGVVAPKATPAEIIDKLNQEINAVVADPKMKGQLVDDTC